MKKLFSFVLVFVMLFTACGKSVADDWQEQYDLGMRYLTENNYDEAILAFTAAIDIDSKMPEAYLGLSQTYLFVENFEKAREVWLEVDELELNNEEQIKFDFYRSVYNDIEEFVKENKNGVCISSVRYDQKSFASGKETSFEVSAVYRIPEEKRYDLSVLANTEDPYTWTEIIEPAELPSKYGVSIFSINVVPSQWDNCYFGLQVLLSGETEYRDVWFISPDGNLDAEYIPQNAYGATEFAYRNEYIDFNGFSKDEQIFIQSMANAALAGDTDAMISLVGFESDNLQDSYTMWNDYKIQIYGSDTTAGIEIRPEFGVGYYYWIYLYDSSDEEGSAKATSVVSLSCNCEKWQWNGNLSGRSEHSSFHVFASGGNVYDEEVCILNGQLVDGLKEGVFTNKRSHKEIWSEWIDNNMDYSEEYSETFVNGEGVEGELCFFSNGVLGCNGSGMDNLYW